MFDTSHRRQSFLSWGLRFALETTFDPREPMGNIAASRLDDVIVATLVGLHAEIAPVLPRAIQWLDHAIQNEEDFGEDRNFHRQKLHSARALGFWLNVAINTPEAWGRAALFQQAYWETENPPMSPKDVVAVGCLDDYMAFSLQAGQYGQAIETYERLVGVRKISLRTKLRPREYAYAVCLHQEQGHFDEPALLEAGRRMLRAHLEEQWFGRGQSLRAATWLKVVHWDSELRAGRSPSLTPVQVILKAYDDMPSVARPAFVM